MARPRRYSDEQIIEALEWAKGMVFVAAAKIGCSPDTVYDRIKQVPTVATCLQSCRGTTLDVAEMKLYEAILAGEAWAILFMLRTHGKQRGYTERLEFEEVKKKRRITPKEQRCIMDALLTKLAAIKAAERGGEDAPDAS